MLLGIALAISISSVVVLVYVTSVATEIQSSSSDNNSNSPLFLSAEGSSQPITSKVSNFESAGITNSGTTTTNTSTPTTTTTPQQSGNLTQTVSSVASPTNRTFYLENLEIEAMPKKFGIPSDVFSLTQIAAKQGDTVTINFYNLEQSGGSQHSFVLHNGPYNVDQEVDPQQNTTITFKATQAGVFQYFCKYHPPTMTGQLIVLP
jgi:plastocyanin